MKLKLLLTLIFINFTLFLFAQETTKPIKDVEIERSVSIIDIEGKKYENVKVNLKSTSPDYFISDIYRVKVNITNEEGKSLWKKTLKNVYLYVFSNGQVQVGKPNFDMIVLYVYKNDTGFTGKIREKEGI